MTEQQYEKLKANKHLYDYLKRVQTINTAEEAFGNINDVHNELYGSRMDGSCQGCVTSGMNRIYNDYTRHEKYLNQK